MDTIVTLLVIAVVLGIMMVIAMTVIIFAVLTAARRVPPPPVTETPKTQHTRATKAGLEDASLVLVRALIEAKNEIEYLTKHIEYSTHILGEVGKGPYNYDPDQPSLFDEMVGRRTNGR
jgi:hypothetical protein